jgi:hypothetical protein
MKISIRLLLLLPICILSVVSVSRAGVYFDGNTTHGFVYDANGFQVVDAPGAVVTSVFAIIIPARSWDPT